MKFDFVTIASHQLRTPLSAMKWFLEMLIAGNAGKLTGRQREFLSEVYKSNERMIRLVNDLLIVSKISNQFDVRFVTCVVPRCATRLFIFVFAEFLFFPFPPIIMFIISFYLMGARGGAPQKLRWEKQGVVMMV